MAAARNLLMVTRSAELDGHVFYLGLEAALDCREPFSDKARAAARSTSYLIKDSIFKSKRAGQRLGMFSLELAPLADLLNIYRHREATDPRDKLFALLGMASDIHIPAELLPDYSVPWQSVYSRLFRHFVGQDALVKTFNTPDVVTAQARGWVVASLDTAFAPDVGSLPI